MRVRPAHLLVCAAIAGLVPAPGAFAQRPDHLAALNREIAAAESALQDGERQLAESRYRSALLEGWMLVGALASSDGKLAEARTAFERATAATANARAAEQALAAVQVQLGEYDAALRILSRLSGIDPGNLPVRHLLAQAAMAGGHPEAAVQELEEAHSQAPDDLETTFALASAYLRVKKHDAAEPLFAEVAARRRLPQTYVLIGRAWRDAGAYDRATAALRRALALDPRVRRAHYYLATVALQSEGVVRLDEAIGELQQERKLAPADPLTNLRLGMALVEARRPAEAVPALDIAAAAPRPAPEAFEYLGRAHLAAGRLAEAITNLQRALEMTATLPADGTRLGYIHYTLATALRRAGRSGEAEAHFAEAQRMSANRTVNDRDRLARFLTDSSDPPAPVAATPLPLTVPAFEGLTAAARAQLARQIRATLARTCLNLGVLQAQTERFARAAAFFEQAASIDPVFPKVQYSLGVAYFNAGDFAKAAAALEHALDAEPQNAEARRMLAMAAFNSGDYTRAAALLAADAQRGSDASLEYTYGVALVRSERAGEAERVFSRLLAAHGDTPELDVVLGQAHAQQGDFAAAIAALRHALELKPDVAEANATLGIIYLKQGRLAEAARALRAELAVHAGDVKSRYTLATVLELDGQPDEALAELRAVLKVRPDYADARYLHGKILLARGDAAGAITHLEIAARLAPGEAYIHYQLAQAYQKAGKTELAQAAFQTYQRLRDRQRKEGA